MLSIRETVQVLPPPLLKCKNIFHSLRSGISMFFIITKKDDFLSPPEMQIKNTTKVKDPVDL